MSRKVTIKDVAKEAEVSIATVSYVLNNRNDQKISEKTRKKVLQVVALLNYSPNNNAQVMRSALTGNIAVISVSPNSLYQAETINFLDALSIKSEERGRRLIYNYYKGAETIVNADAAICLNFSLENFKALGAENSIPLILADGYTDEPWCFQVNRDYKDIKGRLAVLKPENVALKERILVSHPDAVFISAIAELITAPDDLITPQKTLFELLSSFGKKATYSDEQFIARIAALFDCIDKALSHAEYAQHSFEV